jgi:hypothetical protein
LVSWKEARQIVEPFSLTKLIEWRGENDNDTEGFEEILRETIVIDDDDELDDADSDTDSNAAGDDGSDTSLEIVQETLAPKDLNVGVGEKVRPAVTSVGRPPGRALLAAVQTPLAERSHAAAACWSDFHVSRPWWPDFCPSRPTR